MGFGQAISTVFRKYATFQGRASRAEFWWFYLFMIIVNGVLGGILGAAVSSSAGGTIVYDETTGEMITTGGGSLGGFAIVMIIIVSIWALATIIPTIAVQVRRLHDTNRSGGWWWIGLLCFVGPIILIIFWALEGTQGDNRFGPAPTA